MEVLARHSSPSTRRRLSPPAKTKTKAKHSASPSLPIPIPSTRKSAGSPTRWGDPSPDLLFDFSPPGDTDSPAPHYFSFTMGPALAAKNRLGLVDTSLHLNSSTRSSSPRVSDRFMYAFPMPTPKPKSRGAPSDPRHRSFASPISSVSRSPSPPFGNAAAAVVTPLSVHVSTDRGTITSAFLPSPSPSPTPSISTSPTPPVSSFPISPISMSEYLALPTVRGPEPATQSSLYSSIGASSTKVPDVRYHEVTRGRGRASKPRRS